MSKDIRNHETVNTIYGFFPEIPGNSGRIDIHSAWIRENVTEYKRLGKSLEECDRELTSVISRAIDNELFLWAGPDMEALFHEDIEKFFNQ